MKAKKLPSGNWNVRAYSHDEIGKDGKKKKVFVSFTASTKAEAMRMAAEFANNKKLSERPQDMTVAQCLDKYISSREKVLSPSTIRGYRALERANFKSISTFRVGSLSNTDVQQFVNELSASLSPKSVRNIYALFSAAVEMVSGRQFKVTLPAKRPPEYDIPTSDEVTRLMDAADQKMKMCIALSGIGTLRRGEICGLKYKDVLYDFNAVYVHTDMVQTPEGDWYHKDIPKNSNSIRRVDLPPEVMELIGEGDPEDFIYPDNPNRISVRFRRLADKYGLHCRFHDLRHYSASIMHAIGVPDAYIMQRGGWKSDVVLKSVYRNSLSDEARKYTSLTNEYFQRNVLPGGEKKTPSDPKQGKPKDARQEKNMQHEEKKKGERSA